MSKADCQEETMTGDAGRFGQIDFWEISGEHRDEACWAALSSWAREDQSEASIIEQRVREALLCYSVRSGIADGKIDVDFADQLDGGSLDQTASDIACKVALASDLRSAGDDDMEAVCIYVDAALEEYLRRTLGSGQPLIRIA